MNLRVCDVGHQVSDPRKWLHYFDDVRVVVYVVSLSDYETSSIRDDLSDFISFCELECIDKSPIMLLFSHADKLEEKLPAQPLGDSYPEYNGPNDMEAAARFIAGMFTQAAPHRQVSTYFGRGLDSIAMRDTVAAINSECIPTSKRTIC
jgi:hypothetical protein